MIHVLSVTVAIPSAALTMSVHALKTDKEADDTVKRNHNYRLWIVSATSVWTTFCLTYSLDHKNTVLGLAEMEFIFPTAACILLCFVLVATEVLINT